MDGLSGIEAVLYEIRDAVKTMVDLLNRHLIVIQPILIPMNIPVTTLLGRLIYATHGETSRGHPGALVVPGSNPGGPTTSG